MPRVLIDTDFQFQSLPGLLESETLPPPWLARALAGAALGAGHRASFWFQLRVLCLEPGYRRIRALDHAARGASGLLQRDGRAARLRLRARQEPAGRVLLESLDCRRGSDRPWCDAKDAFERHRAR